MDQASPEGVNHGGCITRRTQFDRLQIVGPRMQLEEASGTRHQGGGVKEEASGGYPGGSHLEFIWGVIWEAFWQTWAPRSVPKVI